MGSVSRYAEVNALIRAHIPDLLTVQQYGELAGAADVSEAWSKLKGTVYGEWLHDGTQMEPVAVDRALGLATALQFKRTLRALRDKSREVGLALLSRWDLDNFEEALRAWHAKDSSYRPPSSDTVLVYSIPFSQIAASENLESMAELFRHTPYGKPLLASGHIYSESGSIFHVELALEKAHYRALLAAIETLGGADAGDGRRIVGAEIDLINLAWLSRCASYGEVQPAVIREAMIPSPSPITHKLQQSGTSAHSIAEVSQQFLENRNGGDTSGFSDLNRIALIESIVVQATADTARHLLTGYPFGISCVLAYYFFLRVELRNLRTIFSGKACGIAAEELLTKLYGSG